MGLRVVGGARLARKERWMSSETQINLMQKLEELEGKYTIGYM